MRQSEHCGKPLVLASVDQHAEQRRAFSGHVDAANRSTYLAKIITFFKKSSHLRKKRHGATTSAKIITFSDLKRREQRVEWRRRQAYYHQHGRSPGLTIIKLNSTHR